MGKNKYRSLLESGAEVSIMHRCVYSALKQKPVLIKKVALLQSVNGGLLKIDGFVTLSCKIGNTECTHRFYVSLSINRNFILGRNWLVQNGVRLYFDLGILKFCDTTVPLEEDIHIASLVRLGSKTVLKSQSATVWLEELRTVVRYLLVSCMQFQL